MKKWLALCLTLCLLVSMFPGVPVYGETGEDTSGESQGASDTAVWEYILEEETLTLTAWLGTAADVYVPAWLEIEGVSYPVRKLGDGLFANRDDIHSVTLGSGITELGSRVFEDADALVCVLLSQELTAIGDRSFASCDTLNSLILYDGIVTLGEGVFADCPNLTVWCNENTQGYAYAQLHGIPIEILNPDATPELVTLDGVSYYVMNGEAIAVDYEGTASQVTIPAQVEGFPVTELRETFRDFTGTCIVTLPEGLREIGDYAFYNSGAVPASIPDSVLSIGTNAFMGSRMTSLVLPSGLKEIGGFAFTKCTNLTSVSLPDSLTSLGEYAFWDCEMLETVKLSSGLTTIQAATFMNCKALAAVELPAGITSVGANAFSGCTALGDVVLNEGLVTVGGSAFADCSAMRQVVIPKTVTTMYANSFPSSTVLLVYSGSSAHTFAKNNDLLFFLYDGSTEIQAEVVDGVTYCIVDGEAIAIAFDASTTSVTIPSTVAGCPVTELRGTFQDCTTLRSIVISEGVKIIGDNTFNSCSGLSSVTLPNSLTTIGKQAFNFCTGLKTLTLPEGLQSIGQSAFFYCTGLKSVSIPDSVTSLGANAFYKCTALTSVTLSSGLKTLPASVFYGCSKLTAVTIPEGVQVIQSQAFSGCKFTELTLPESLRTLGTNAFYGSTLNMVVIPSGVTSMQTSSFPSNTMLLVYEDSYAHTFASSKGLLHFVYDGENLPQVQTLNGVTYCLVEGCAIAVGYSGTATSVTIPETVAGCPVTELRGTFKGSSVTSVTLPQSLTTIGTDAFYNSKLTAVNLPENLQVIGKQAFYGCTGLKSITFPDSLEEIGLMAFYNCTSLQEVTLPSLTTLGDFAFWKCTRVEKVTLQGTITGFGASAFNGCTAITQVTLEDGVTRVGSGAFSACSNLEQVMLPESLRLMQTNSFPSNTILLVRDGSYAHTFAESNGLLYFVIRKTDNPEIRYGAEISGQVTYSDGTPAAAVTVEIFYHDGVSKQQVLTDDSGSYVFTYAEVGDYTIRVRDDLGGTATTRVSVKRMNVFSVFVAGDRNLTMKKAYQVSGSVSVPGAVITVTDDKGNVLHTVTADEQGGFTVENLPNGTYTFTAQADSMRGEAEVTVFGGDISDLVLTLQGNTASLWGYVHIMDRDGNTAPRGWADVTVFNSRGTVVARTKTDAQGYYRVGNLLVDDYIIVAQIGQLRPDKHHGYDREHRLAGYAFQSVTEVAEYVVPTIVMQEQGYGRNVVSGKVTAQGETQDCRVLLQDEQRREVAVYYTGKNGKFTFRNVPNGVYFLTAVTKSDGVAFSVILVWDGEVIGQTELKVRKSDTIHARETLFATEMPVCANREEAMVYRDRIAQEKRFYDGLSEAQKRELSEAYLLRLERLCAWIADCQVVTQDGVTVEQSGLVLSGDELEAGSQVTFNLSVTPADPLQSGTDAVTTDQEYLYHQVDDAAGEDAVCQYYEITMSKTVEGVEQPLTSVYKNTDATGKFRITMPIPEEYRGYASYSVVHIHEGEVYTLTDLDEDPNTVTFEVDKFSSFVLTANEVTVPEIAPAYPSLSFEDEVYMNVYFTADKLENVSELGLMTFSGDVTRWDVENAQSVVPGYVWNDTLGLYAVRTQGIPAKCLGDAVYFSVYARLTDGTYVYGDLIQYSPKTYAYNLLDSETTGQSMKSLVVAMLNYGARAQEFFDYNTGDLVNSGVTAEQQALVAPYDASLIAPVVKAEADKLGDFAATESGFTRYYPSITFEGAFSINYYFLPDAQVSGEMTLYFWNASDYSGATALTAENATRVIPVTQSDSYCAAVTGITAKELDSTVYVAAVYSDGTETYCTGILSYSIGAYCVSRAAAQTPMQPLAQATALYGCYAKLCFNAE